MKWPHRRPLTWLVDVKRLLLQMGQSLSRLLLRHVCVGVLDEMHALHVMQWKKSWDGQRGAVEESASGTGGGWVEDGIIEGSSGRGDHKKQKQRPQRGRTKRPENGMLFRSESYHAEAGVDCKASTLQQHQNGTSSLAVFDRER